MYVRKLKERKTPIRTRIILTLLGAVLILLPFAGAAAGVGDFVARAGTVSPFAADAIVGNEAELRAAVGVPPNNTEYIIELAADIKLSSAELVIPNSIIIRLVSGHDAASAPYRLIGANNCNVVSANGKLILDGITVTHEAGENGRGVWVGTSGELALSSGEISGNAVAGDGGGVFLEGRFRMEGGRLSGNTAQDGGGLYISNRGSGDTWISGGRISNNEATNNGGGIWVGRNNLNKLRVDAGVVFSGNSAIASYTMQSADKKTYEKQIGNNGTGVEWTGTFENGYNNYDISYFWGDQLCTVVFDPRNGTPKSGFAERFVMSGASLGADMPPSPVRAGYTFVCWRTDKDGKGSIFTAKTTVSRHITVYAEWKAIEEKQQEHPRTEKGAPPAGDDKTEPAPDMMELIAVMDPDPEEEPIDETPADTTPPKAGPVNDAEVEPEPDYNTEPVMTRNQGLTPGAVLEKMKDAGVPMLVLGDREVPMHHYEDLPVWAPINLILAAVGVVLAISFVLQGLKSRKREYEHRGIDWRTALVVILGAAGIILFVLTEDTKNLIILFDRWTALNAVIFAAELVALKLASSKKEIEQQLF